jgi:hypothetical protein
MYAEQRKLIAKGEQCLDEMGEEEKSLLADLKLSHTILDEHKGEYLARYNMEKAMWATFSREQQDFICAQIGHWYYMMKPLLEGSHNLGYMKEVLKNMICGDE